jgi:hypothetical protein
LGTARKLFVLFDLQAGHLPKLQVIPFREPEIPSNAFIHRGLFGLTLGEVTCTNATGDRCGGSYGFFAAFLLPGGRPRLFAGAVSLAATIHAGGRPRLI